MPLVKGFCDLHDSWRSRAEREMQLQAQDARAVNGNAHSSKTNGRGSPGNFLGGERGCAGGAVRGCDAWELLLLGCRGRLLVLRKGVGLMAAHARLAFHEWIRLQLCHLIGVTGVACA